MGWLKKNWILIMIIGISAMSYIVTTIQKEDVANKELSTVPEELQDMANSEDETAEHEVYAQANPIYIDVKGEVKSPGVYKVEGEKRVSDLIELAGGFTDDANEQMVNLAQKVADEMVIYVPELGDGNVHLSSPEFAEFSSKIRMNHATKEEIASLTGIGEVKANAIVQYREENGFFQTANDLLLVSGIGEKTLERIKGEIQIP